jgi:hypothetical protein
MHTHALFAVVICSSSSSASSPKDKRPKFLQKSYLVKITTTINPIALMTLTSSCTTGHGKDHHHNKHKEENNPQTYLVALE